VTTAQYATIDGDLKAILIILVVLVIVTCVHMVISALK
jgi:hypothetical protein